jgi:uncharacterized membrane protein YgcG
MKIAYTTVLLFLLSSTSVTTYSIPQSDLVVRDALPVESIQVPDLEKRRGGGGGGGRGGGSSGGSGGGSGGSSGGRGGSSGSSGSSG